MGSPRNPPRTRVEPQNCLCHCYREFGEEKSPNAVRKTLKGFKYPGHRTCPVKELDLSSGTPDQTCPVLTVLVR
jgi:hypothetical protein